MPVFSVAHTKLLDSGDAVVAKTFVDAHREGNLGCLILDFGETDGYCDAIFECLGATLLGCREKGMGCVPK